MKGPLKILPFLFLTMYLSSFSGEKTGSDSLQTSDSISLAIFAASATAGDSLKLQAGDSIFIFGGELYYRARSGDREFFIEQDSLVTHADSLIIYQYYRLNPRIGAVPNPDSVTSKIERQRCTAITKDGIRCKRLAEPGSDRCWQHKR